jgi:glucose-6-phosphate isomerase
VNPRGLNAQAGAHSAAVRARLEALRAGNFAGRLAGHDDALWGDDPAHRRVAANRLGWLDSPRALRAQAADLDAFAAGVAAEGFTHAVLLGMGGSSLAPEVLRATFGVRPGRLELTVLDNTSPAAVRAVAAAHERLQTLFIVASKSGGTIEVASFEKYFWERVSAVRGASAGRAFVAITDPDTSLAALARTRGYRRTFVNAPDIGGRYSALSYFGLLPAALIGVDLPALLDGALAEHDSLASGDADGIALGAALGELANAGRDKLTLIVTPPFVSVGTWVEQLVAESTGKLGRGIVPVAEETLAAPGAYADDRVFVAVGSPLPAETERDLDALSAAGHPVLRWNSPGAEWLGADFLRWEIATATAAAVLGVDPFDEPNVAEAKAATQAVLQRFHDEGRLPARAVSAKDGELSATVPAAAGTPGTAPAAWAEWLLAQVKPGDYVALLAYLHRTESRHARLQAIRHAARARTRAATTLGYGPRFLHSTGQLHKGGPNTGVYLLLTADEGDLPIPGERYGFGTLRAAQAAGDFEVLERHGRRVLHVHLGRDGREADAGLERLAEAFAALRTV